MEEELEAEIVEEEPKKRGRKKVERNDDGMRILVTKKQSRDMLIKQEKVDIGGLVTDAFTKDGHSWWRDCHGRIRALPKYDTVEQLVEAIEKWEANVVTRVQSGEDIIPDAEALAVGLDISMQSLRAWQNGERGEAFQKVIGVELNKIAAVKNQLAMKGAIPSMVWMAMMNNVHGYVQNQKVDIDITAKREPIKAEDLLAQARLLPG